MSAASFAEEVPLEASSPFEMRIDLGKHVPETDVKSALKTGDVGFLAQDGMLHVIDRRDRFLRIGYQRTSCSEIEDALRRLGRLTEVAALPVTKRGGDDSLLVVLAHSDVKGAPLRDLLVRHFPSVRDPRFVRRPHLPRTGSGKIAYAQLLAEFGS